MRVDRRLALVGLVLVGLASPARAQVDLARAQSLAAEAGRAYEGGDFDAAVSLYGQAMAAGLDHGVIHYNLGNAHYKRGDLGPAIASYLRALRRDPRDAQARANLEQARSLIRDEALSPLDLPVFLTPLRWVYERLSLNEWGWLGLCCLLLVALLGTVGQWTRRATVLRRRAMGTFLVVGAVALVVMGLHYRREVMLDSAVVVAEEVDVRSGPGGGYNLAFKVHEGLQVFVSERREDWVQIHLGGDLVGWVRQDQIELL